MHNSERKLLEILIFRFSLLRLVRILIIDSHVHICESPYTQDKISIKTADETVIDYTETRSDLSVDRLLQDMDECHVDRALVMAFHFASNEFLSKAVKAHPSRLVGFAWVTNPRDEYNSVRELDRAVSELGLKGLKLHPGTQAFNPADLEILPIIRRAAELNVPILIHTYPWPPGYFHHNLPEHIDTLKKRVPEATIIIAHMGGPRFLDLLTIAPQPGIYVETSHALPMIADLFGIDFVTRFLRKIGVDNVVFGSDWWGSIKMIETPMKLIQKMDLKREEKEKILGENIRKVMGLK